MPDQKPLPMEAQVPVKLTADERDRKTRSLLRSMKRIDEYNADIAKHRAAKKALIEAEEETIAELRRVLEADEQLVAQGDLFVDPHTATRGLAEVAERAGDTDALIAEQSELMDATDAKVGDDEIPVVSMAPVDCPLCTSTTRTFDDGARVMCQSAECTWVARVVIGSVPEPTEEQRAEAMQWIAGPGGGQDAVIESAAMYWERMAPRSTFDAAMVGWCARSGAFGLVATLLREAIERARDNIGFPAAQQPQEPLDRCTHQSVQGRKKPRAGKHLVCPDCNLVLHNCESCKRYETPDDLGPCDWDHCGTAVCVDCQVKHEESAAPNDSAASDESDDARPCAACGLVETDNSVCLDCRAYLCDGCRDKHNCEESSAQVSA